MVRINKYLSQAGICSRREADRLLGEGRILINGSPALMGQQVNGDEEIWVDGKPVGRTQEEIILMFNKPRGIVCSTVSTHGETNVVDFVNYPERIYPVGRLDKESEGLLLLTNNGDLMNRVLKSKNGHEKEYLVRVDRPISEQDLRQMERGVKLSERMTKPCRCSRLTTDSFRIVISEGINRQIRRMCQQFGYEVVSLERVRFMMLTLGNLARGEYRKLTADEIADLKAAAYQDMSNSADDA